MTKEENEALMYASDEDIKFYQKCEEGLYSIGGIDGTGKDEDGVPIPYHCGPHSLKSLRRVVKEINPKSILEIGFNCGHSSAMWLELTDANVFSCDISNKKETLHGVEVLSKRYGKRFKYENRNSNQWMDYCLLNEFDAIFIDGGHLIEDVRADISHGLWMEIEYFIFDDILNEFGPGVLPAINENPSLVKIFHDGNIGLYKNTSI